MSNILSVAIVFEKKLRNKNFRRKQCFLFQYNFIKFHLEKKIWCKIKLE